MNASANLTPALMPSSWSSELLETPLTNFLLFLLTQFEKRQQQQQRQQQLQQQQQQPRHTMETFAGYLKVLKRSY